MGRIPSHAACRQHGKMPSAWKIVHHEQKYMLLGSRGLYAYMILVSVYIKRAILGHYSINTYNRKNLKLYYISIVYFLMQQ